MAPEVARRLHGHGVPTFSSYGQTETAGFILAGFPGRSDRLAVFRPISAGDAGGGTMVLVSDDEGGEAAGEGEEGPNKEGELELRGCASVFGGYLGAPARAAGAPYRTGDVFKEVRVGRSTLLRHCCRTDDILLHTSGEMSNPLLTEGPLRAR